MIDNRKYYWENNSLGKAKLYLVNMMKKQADVDSILRRLQGIQFPYENLILYRPAYKIAS